MSDRGYQILVGRNGQEGWQVFQREQERIDLVILDLSMPKMSGQELLKHMFALNPAVKVIISTGNPSPQCRDIGRPGYAHKALWHGARSTDYT